MRVIGVIGRNGSGKDEVLKYLRDQYRVPFLSTGDMVREIAARQGRTPDRSTLQEISGAYFREHGQGCFVKMVSEKIRENGWPVAGMSGVRSPQDVRTLKEILGASFVLVAVSVTDPRVRFERMRQRGEERDTDSYQRFLEQDEAEESIFRVEEAAGMADYTLTNDGSRQDLQRAVADLVAREGLLAAG